MSASTDLRRGLVEADILERAAGLFAARGYAITSMQNIADTLGMSRPSLYHYFGSKDEILARLIDGLATGAEAALAEAEDSTSPPDRRLHQLAVALIRPIAEAPGRFRLLQTADRTLIAGAEERFQRLQRAVVHTVADVIKDGIRSGVFRRVDPQVATFSVLGIVNWVAWWYAPERGPSAEELCRSLADMAVASLRASGDAIPAGSAAEVVAAIRRDLDHLDRLFEESP